MRSFCLPTLSLTVHSEDYIHPLPCVSSGSTRTKWVKFAWGQVLLCVCVYTYNTPVVQEFQKIKRMKLSSCIYLLLLRNHRRAAVSLSEVEQGIRQLQQHNRKIWWKKLSKLESFISLLFWYKSRKNAFKMKTVTSAYLVTKGTCGFTWFIQAIRGQIAM